MGKDSRIKLARQYISTCNIPAWKIKFDISVEPNAALIRLGLKPLTVRQMRRAIYVAEGKKKKAVG